ncbi:hypothetical protein TNCT_286831 [Trichonephila clavata]|uniref:Uncharacterized protein n=1 Tax=Trichonephila clavata TaxID=2740835 RepID=A0A8X6FLX2_TRICU|nr:hypothetical protein TNCT_286831 [Trichonephila clavata]
MAKKLRKFLILLDNESLLYFPGSFLTGRVLVDLDEDTAVTGVYIPRNLSAIIDNELLEENVKEKDKGLKLNLLKH